MVRPLPKLEPDDDAPSPSWVSSYNPFRIVRSIFHRSVTYLFPPTTVLTIASHLVPLLVCLSLIPLLLFFSLFSGWYIWKNIPVAWQVPIYLQYGSVSFPHVSLLPDPVFSDSLLPYAELSLPPLSITQPYDVSLQLVVPASEANFALGNFMATLSLTTPSNKTLVSVSRSVRSSRSPSCFILPTVFEAIALPPKRSTFSFSASPRLIDLDVPLLSSYVPGTSKINARIDLGRRDGWKSLGSGEGRELSVWNAALRGAVRRHGIRYALLCSEPRVITDLFHQQGSRVSLPYHLCVARFCCFLFPFCHRPSRMHPAYRSVTPSDGPNA